jgi:uncharacterized membrane protein
MGLLNRTFFSPQEEALITDAIENAEKSCSGEVRLHVEPYCKIDVLDRAADVFGFLHMQETELRNGILFYLAYEDHKFAVIGDSGINSLVPADFWESVRDEMTDYFRRGEIAAGLAKGIEHAGEKLKEYFPYRDSDSNELKNDISYG